MINVTAEFPPYDSSQTRPYTLADAATVADLKAAVSADGNAPAAFQGQATESLIVLQGGAVLDDATGLIDQNSYDVALALDMADYEDDNDEIPDGYQAPPPSPRGGHEGGNGQDNGNGGNGANGPRYPQDGVMVWSYVNGVQQGPQQYNVAADSTAAALKEQIAADPNSPLGPVASEEIAVYDGNDWLSDNDPIIGGAAYTVQRADPNPQA